MLKQMKYNDQKENLAGLKNQIKKKINKKQEI